MWRRIPKFKHTSISLHKSSPNFKSIHNLKGAELRESIPLRPQKVTSSSSLQNMKDILSSPSRSNVLPYIEPMNSPIPTKRPCGTPQPSSIRVFRPRRAKLFDEDTEDLLQIRKGSVLQPILTDHGEAISDQGKENYSILAMVCDKSNPIHLFPTVLDSNAAKNGVGDTRNRMQ